MSVEDYQIFKVKWLDSNSKHGWVFKEDIGDFCLEIVGVGYLVKQTPEYIILSGHISEQCVDSPICIPRVAITSMEQVL